MKRLLNTLYVTTQGSYINREGTTLVVSLDGEVRLQVPAHTLQSIACFGRVMMSPPALHLCAEHRVGVSFFSEHGRLL
ncbi:MAG: subtype I-C CRISPR-associated endonuclease Cas1, partial [Candidatus Hydrogenedentota bacterium]